MSKLNELCLSKMGINFADLGDEETFRFAKQITDEDRRSLSEADLSQIISSLHTAGENVRALAGEMQRELESRKE